MTPKTEHHNISNLDPKPQNDVYNQKPTLDNKAMKPQHSDYKNQSPSLNLKTKSQFETKKQYPSQKQPYEQQKKIINKQATTTQRGQVQQAKVNELLSAAKNQKQGQYINKYPIILVHGFIGLTGEAAPKRYPHYWAATNTILKKN